MKKELILKNLKSIKSINSIENIESKSANVLKTGIFGGFNMGKNDMRINFFMHWGVSFVYMFFWLTL